jgi:hypothetical protein
MMREFFIEMEVGDSRAKLGPVLAWPVWIDRFFFVGDDFLLDFADFLVVVLRRLIVAFLGELPVGVSNSDVFPERMGDFAVELRADVFMIY